MQSADSQHAYRPDIDGLRAVAVTSVIAFHAFPDSVPGGFVGVDIFFVISGFLITGILQREIAGSRYSIRAFYARRIKRLFPALAVVLVASLLIGWTVLLRDEFRQLGRHVSAGAGFVANILLWAEAGYFDVDAKLKPLLHLWSLGIEEQYYLVWPLVMALVFKARLNFLLVAGVLFAASFAANLALVDAQPAAAFFLPQARLWELMSGGVLAYLVWLVGQRRVSWLTPAGEGGGPHWLADAAATLGLALIGLSLALVDEHKSFPGWWALAPTLGSVLLIGSGPDTWVARNLLSRPGMVFIGLISYPLYLWHWPLLSFARIVASGLPPLETRLAIVAATFLLAWATYRYVELPIRFQAGRAKRSGPVVAGLATAVLVIFVVGFLVDYGVPRERLRELSLTLSEASADWDYPGDEEALIPGDSDEAVLFFGDSYVAQLYPRIAQVAAQEESRRTVIFHTAAGCAPVPGISRRSEPRCITYAQRGFELAASEQVKVVVIGGSWIGMLKRGDYYEAGDEAMSSIDFEDPARLQAVLDDFGRELARLRGLGKEVYVVLNPPGGGRADPKVVQGSRISVTVAREVKSVPLAEHLRRTAAINEQVAASAEAAGAAVIDPTGWLCADGHCSFTDDRGIPYFKDATHLRASFVRCCVKDFDRLIAPLN